MPIDKDKAVEAQRRVHTKNGYNVDAELLTAEELRELFDELDRIKNILEFENDETGYMQRLSSVIAERDRYKAALEFIASSSNCGTCDDCLRAAKEALK